MKSMSQSGQRHKKPQPQELDNIFLSQNSPCSSLNELVQEKWLIVPSNNLFGNKKTMSVSLSIIFRRFRSSGGQGIHMPHESRRKRKDTLDFSKTFDNVITFMGGCLPRSPIQFPNESRQPQGDLVHLHLMTHRAT